MAPIIGKKYLSFIPKLNWFEIPKGGYFSGKKTITNPVGKIFIEAQAYLTHIFSTIVHAFLSIALKEKVIKKAVPKFWEKTAFKVSCVTGAIIVVGAAWCFYSDLGKNLNKEVGFLDKIKATIDSSFQSQDLFPSIEYPWNIVSFATPIITGIVAMFCYTRSERPFSQKVISRFPLGFLSQIKTYNEKKSPTTPYALILTAASDYNGSLTCPATQFFILEIAKTYKVGLEIIKNIDDIDQAIRRTNPNLLVFNAHGSSSSLALSHDKDNNSIDYTSKDVQLKSETFNLLSPSAVIFLKACDVGSKNKDRTDGLAQTIANISHRKVFAPLKELDPLKISFSFCKIHQMPEMTDNYDSKTQRQVLIFQENAKPFACSETKDPSYFSEMRNYLIECAEDKDPNLQNLLGLLYEEEDNHDEAEKWFLKALHNKHPHPNAEKNLQLLAERKAILAERKAILSEIQELRSIISMIESSYSLKILKR